MKAAAISLFSFLYACRCIFCIVENHRHRGFYNTRVAKNSGKKNGLGGGKGSMDGASEHWNLNREGDAV